MVRSHLSIKPTGREVLVEELDTRDSRYRFSNVPARVHLATLTAISGTTGKATVEFQGRTIEQAIMHGSADIGSTVVVLFAGNVTVVIGNADAASSELLNGAGPPGSGVGDDGDFYIDTTNYVIYGPKTGGAWGAGTSLIGPSPPDIPVGTVVMYGANSAPTGWLLCEGQAVSRTTYSALFAVIGTTYGNGNGTSTFNVPDVQQRFPMGHAASGVGATLGGVGGNISHVHTQPGHSHTQPNHSHVSGTLVNSTRADHTHSGGYDTGTAGAHTHTIPSAGGHDHGSPTDGPSTQTARGNSGSLLDVATSTHTHHITTGGGHTHGGADSGGSHEHNIPASNPSGSHAHDITGNTAIGGNDDTGVSGNDDTGTANPPFITFKFLIKYG